jgi:hypothetical protein
VATTGVKGGKISVVVPEVKLTEAIEVLLCTEEAKDNLWNQPVHQI